MYATDEDLSQSHDPLVNAFDLGQDPLAYARDRMALAGELLQNLDKNVVRDGDSWSRLRSAFSVLLGQYGNAAYLAAAYIGGQSVSRDFKGGEPSRDPITPIPGQKQREALEFLASEILSDKAFKFPPQLLRKLGTDRWYHWGSESMLLGGDSDYNVYDRILAIQSIVLDQCLDATVLRRLQNQQLLVDSAGDALPLADVFRTVTDSVWSELKRVPSETTELNCSTIRRNLQRAHLQQLCRIVIGGRGSSYASVAGYVVLFGGDGSYPPDARSLARLHLQQLGDQLKTVLDNAEVKMDDTTRAHLRESRDLIEKVSDRRGRSGTAVTGNAVKHLRSPGLRVSAREQDDSRGGAVSAESLAACQSRGLFDEVVAGPLIVGGDDVLVPGLLQRAGFVLQPDQLGVRRKVAQTVSAEVIDLLEAVLFHEGQQALAHRPDAAVTVLHDAGAHLHGMAAQQQELGRMITGFNPADPAQRPPRILIADDFRNLHAHPQGDRAEWPSMSSLPAYCTLRRSAPDAAFRDRFPARLGSC